MTKYYMSIWDKNMKNWYCTEKCHHTLNNTRTHFYMILFGLEEWQNTMFISDKNIKNWYCTEKCHHTHSHTRKLFTSAITEKLAPMIHFLKAKCKYSIHLFFFHIKRNEVGIRLIVTLSKILKLVQKIFEIWHYR